MCKCACANVRVQMCVCKSVRLAHILARQSPIGLIIQRAHTAYRLEETESTQPTRKSVRLAHILTRQSPCSLITQRVHRLERTVLETRLLFK